MLSRSNRANGVNKLCGLGGEYLNRERDPFSISVGKEAVEFRGSHNKGLPELSIL